MFAWISVIEIVRIKDNLKNYTKNEKILVNQIHKKIPNSTENMTIIKYF